MSTTWHCPHCDGEIDHKSLKVTTPQASMRAVVNDVAILHGLTVQNIMGKTRTRKIVEARHHAIKAIRERWPAYSSCQIGTFFGMDHSSILSALGTLNTRLSRQNREEGIPPSIGRRLNVPKAIPILEG